MADFAIIGLGRFGRAVARGLGREGQEVLAIDLNPARLDAVKADVERVVVADTTDEAVVASLALEQMTCAVVTMGSRATEASVLTTAILRELGIPRIVARAFDERHARLLLAIGAHEVVNPEEELGRQVATRLAHPGIVADMRFGDAVLAEVETPEAFVGRSLKEIDLGHLYGITVLAVRRRGKTRINPSVGEAPESGDVLVLLGSPEAIRKVSDFK
jgi:trk system potassium uptake protein TrkA